MSPGQPAVLLVAFASGVAALLYQVVWLRWFQILFGSTAYAASATLCAFFTGLAIGAVVFGHIASRSSRPLVVYAGIELAAGALALAVPWVFGLYDFIYPGLYEGLAEHRAAFTAVKFGLAMVMMLPVSFLLGGTFPLLASSYVADVSRLGRSGGLLYAINTFGAALGSGLGALWLPDRVGVVATYGIAIGLSLSAAAMAFALSRASNAPSAAPAPVSPLGDDAEEVRRSSRELRFVAFASGFGTLALEVLLIHAIAQLLDHSVYSHGAVLVVVLLCLATGAGLVSLTSGLIPAPRLLVAALIVECLLLLALPGQFAGFELAAEGGRAVAGLRTAILLGGPAMLIGALVLPLTFRLSRGGSVGEQTGGLLSANTAGGILGSLAAGFVLLESFGIWPSIAIVGLGYGAAAVAFLGSPAQRVRRAALLAVAIVAILSSSINPWQLPRVALGPGDRLVDLREGAHGVVSVIDKGPNRLMKIDNHYTLSGAGPLGARKERTGHIPLLLHPEPRRVAFIGSATGHTSGAAVVHPVEEIVLVEIVPEVQELAAQHFAKSNRGVHHDPRTRLVVEDGRNHMRATDEFFDVIVADLFSPWRPGVGSLYTREHFEAVRRRLAPGGLFCQWLPAYQHRRQTFESIAATFLQVFPNATVWRGDFYRTLPRVALIGFEGEPPSVAQVNDRVRALARRGVPDRWVVRPRGFWMLYVGPLAAIAPSLSRTPLNSDARPRFEYLAGRSSPFEIHEFLARGWPRISDRLLAGARIDKTFEAAMPSVEDGAELVRLNALHLAGREEAFRLRLARLRERLPVALIERPDPTVAEMWAP